MRFLLIVGFYLAILCAFFPGLMLQVCYGILTILVGFILVNALRRVLNT